MRVIYLNKDLLKNISKELEYIIEEIYINPSLELIVYSKKPSNILKLNLPTYSINSLGMMALNSILITNNYADPLLKHNIPSRIELIINKEYKLLKNLILIQEGEL